ncbi:MAG: ribonuclease HII [Nitrosomonadales bacterium]|nr:ribonuclease HII [Nitrosomonadales bacterium]|tara:strand:- start:1048 stop:1629 length:582 start_codon:yes stop_codon:yes gene_type:complete
MTLICGIDEAGRGPLCGPVFASAVILDSDADDINNLTDSKKLSEKDRIFLHQQIKLKAVEFSFAMASVEEIDKINILQASLLAMKRAFNLLKKQPDYIYIDGIYCPEIKNIPIKAIPKGDSLIQSISAASIIAKVERDRYMLKIDKKYPQYKLKQHKGYPTKEHIKLLNKYGVNEIYRHTFKPVKNLVDKENT